MRGLDSVGTFGAAGYAILGKADWSELLANPEVPLPHNHCFRYFLPRVLQSNLAQTQLMRLVVSRCCSCAIVLRQLFHKCGTRAPSSTQLSLAPAADGEGAGAAGEAGPLLRGAALSIAPSHAVTCPLACAARFLALCQRPPCQGAPCCMGQHSVVDHTQCSTFGFDVQHDC